MRNNRQPRGCSLYQVAVVVILSVNLSQTFQALVSVMRSPVSQSSSHTTQRAEGVLYLNFPPPGQPSPEPPKGVDKKHSTNLYSMPGLHMAFRLCGIYFSSVRFQKLVELFRVGNIDQWFYFLRLTPQQHQQWVGGLSLLPIPSQTARSQSPSTWPLCQ